MSRFPGTLATPLSSNRVSHKIESATELCLSFRHEAGDGRGLRTGTQTRMQIFTRSLAQNSAISRRSKKEAARKKKKRRESRNHLFHKLKIGDTDQCRCRTGSQTTEKQPLLLEVDKDLHISIMDIGTEGFKSLPEVNSICHMANRIDTDQSKHSNLLRVISSI